MTEADQPDGTPPATRWDPWERALAWARLHPRTPALFCGGAVLALVLVLLIT